MRVYQTDGLRGTFGKVDWPGTPVPGASERCWSFFLRGYVNVHPCMCMGRAGALGYVIRWASLALQTTCAARCILQKHASNQQLTIKSTRPPTGSSTKRRWRGPDRRAYPPCTTMNINRKDHDLYIASRIPRHFHFQ